MTTSLYRVEIARDVHTPWTFHSPPVTFLSIVSLG